MARQHQNMTYRELQAYNRLMLTQHHLNSERKLQGLINRGWQQVIALYTWVTQQLQACPRDIESKILSSFAHMQQAATAIKTTVAQVRKRSQQWHPPDATNNIHTFEVRDNSDDPDGNLPATV